MSLTSSSAASASTPSACSGGGIYSFDSLDTTGMAGVVCGVAAPPGDQTKGGDDHGLTRPGLPRDNSEAGVRLEDGSVDDAEVADPQFVKHVRHVSGQHRQRRDDPLLC